MFSDHQACLPWIAARPFDSRPPPWSKAGSRYSFLFASTNHPFCPTLREQLGEECQLPSGVESVQEIIINGRDLQAVTAATHAGIAAARGCPGLIRISAGNYGGRLGKNFVYLRPESDPDVA